MSEYQYYEFLAVDRPLSEEEMRELRSISTRAQITRTSFVNVYNFGDLRADPKEMLERYFDVMVYLASWGTRRLMLRLPADLANPSELEPYSAGYGVELTPAGPWVVCDLSSQDADGDGWDSGEGWMASLAPTREEVLRGDLRALYLGWIRCVQDEELEGEVFEPPVPEGLRDLSSPQTRLAEFLGLDPHLLDTAAEVSLPRPANVPGLSAWVAALPEPEKNRLLGEVAEGRGASVAARLLRRFRREQGDVAPSNSSSRRPRSVSELLAAAEERRETACREAARRTDEAIRLQQEKEAGFRARHLDSLRGREEEIWRMAEEQIRTRQPKQYDEAVQHLADLRDLAAREAETEAFESRFAKLWERHLRKETLLRRLKRAGLTPKVPTPLGF